MIYLNDRLDLLDLDSVLSQLSEQRREQFLAFRHDLGRRTCAASYLLLRQALLEEYGIVEPPLFDYGEHGKPFLRNHPDIFFNMSHCREAALCVVASCPVGVDVETVRTFNESLARYTMNDEELHTILQSDRPDVAFTRFWTQKEALVKLTGEGIRSDMKKVLIGAPDIQTVTSPDLRYVYSIVYQDNKTIKKTI